MEFVEFVVFFLGGAATAYGVEKFRVRRAQRKFQAFLVARTGLPPGYIRKFAYQAVVNGKVEYDGNDSQEAVAQRNRARLEGKQANLVIHGKNRG